jgi:hypothetical protein
MVRTEGVVTGIVKVALLEFGIGVAESLTTTPRNAAPLTVGPYCGSYTRTPEIAPPAPALKPGGIPYGSTGVNVT